MFVIVTSLLISIYLKLIVFMHRVYIRFSNFFFFLGGGGGGKGGIGGILPLLDQSLIGYCVFGIYMDCCVTA